MTDQRNVAAEKCFYNQSDKSFKSLFCSEVSNYTFLGLLSLFFWPLKNAVWHWTILHSHSKVAKPDFTWYQEIWPHFERLIQTASHKDQSTIARTHTQIHLCKHMVYGFVAVEFAILSVQFSDYPLGLTYQRSELQTSQNCNLPGMNRPTGTHEKAFWPYAWIIHFTCFYWNS